MSELQNDNEDLVTKVQLNICCRLMNKNFVRPEDDNRAAIFALFDNLVGFESGKPVEKVSETDNGTETAPPDAVSELVTTSYPTEKTVSGYSETGNKQGRTSDSVIPASEPDLVTEACPSSTSAAETTQDSDPIQRPKPVSEPGQRTPLSPKTNLDGSEDPGVSSEPDKPDDCDAISDPNQTNDPDGSNIINDPNDLDDLDIISDPNDHIVISDPNDHDVISVSETISNLHATIDREKENREAESQSLATVKPAANTEEKTISSDEHATASSTATPPLSDTAVDTGISKPAPQLDLSPPGPLQRSIRHSGCEENPADNFLVQESTDFDSGRVRSRSPSDVPQELNFDFLNTRLPDETDVKSEQTDSAVPNFAAAVVGTASAIVANPWGPADSFTPSEPSAFNARAEKKSSPRSSSPASDSASAPFQSPTRSFEPEISIHPSLNRPQKRPQTSKDLNPRSKRQKPTSSRRSPLGSTKQLPSNRKGQRASTFSRSELETASASDSASDSDSDSASASDSDSDSDSDLDLASDSAPDSVSASDSASDSDSDSDGDEDFVSRQNSANFFSSSRLDSDSGSSSQTNSDSSSDTGSNWGGNSGSDQEFDSGSGSEGRTDRQEKTGFSFGSDGVPNSTFSHRSKKLDTNRAANFRTQTRHEKLKDQKKGSMDIWEEGEYVNDAMFGGYNQPEVSEKNDEKNHENRSANRESADDTEEGDPFGFSEPDQEPNGTGEPERQEMRMDRRVPETTEFSDAREARQRSGRSKDKKKDQQNRKEAKWRKQLQKQKKRQHRKDKKEKREKKKQMSKEKVAQRMKEIMWYYEKANSEEKHQFKQSRVWVMLVSRFIETVSNAFGFDAIHTKGLTANVESSMNSGEFNSAMEACVANPEASRIITNPVASFGATFLDVLMQTHMSQLGQGPSKSRQGIKGARRKNLHSGQEDQGRDTAADEADQPQLGTGTAGARGNENFAPAASHPSQAVGSFATAPEHHVPVMYPPYFPAATVPPGHHGYPALHLQHLHPSYGVPMIPASAPVAPDTEAQRKEEEAVKEKDKAREQEMDSLRRAHEETAKELMKRSDDMQKLMEMVEQTHAQMQHQNAEMKNLRVARASAEQEVALLRKEREYRRHPTRSDSLNLLSPLSSDSACPDTTKPSTQSSTSPLSTGDANPQQLQDETENSFDRQATTTSDSSKPSVPLQNPWAPELATTELAGQEQTMPAIIKPVAQFNRPPNPRDNIVNKLSNVMGNIGPFLQMQEEQEELNRQQEEEAQRLEKSRPTFDVFDSLKETR